MSQNTQQYPRTGTDLQSLPAVRDDDPLAQVETLKIVACSICRAIYIPSGELRAPGSAGLLETAFLGVCRFCFRCQRSACPQCWNPVHHVCASCSEEAHLPFRGPVPSLEGLVFAPAGTPQANEVFFLCRRNGRFYVPETAPSLQEPRQVSAPSKHTVSEPVTSDALPVLQPERVAPVPAAFETYPTWLKEVFGQKANGSVASAPATGTKPWGNPAYMYPPVDPALVWPHASQANWPQMIPTAPQQVVPPVPLVPFAPMVQPQQPTSPAPAIQQISPMADSQGEADLQDNATDEAVSLFERIENVLIVITSILLLSVILMIALSICSAQVNSFILNFLHIDIRTEIAYLLQLR